MSRLRSAKSQEKTEKATAATQASILKLLEAGIETHLIICLHKYNTGDKLRELMDWIKEMKERGVTSARVHILTVNKPMTRQHVLTTAGYLETLIALIRFETDELGGEGAFMDIARDQRDLLQDGFDANVSCTFTGCDPYSTPAVHGIGPDGDLHNCGMANAKDGIDWQKSDTHSSMRSIALYNAPQESGGCQGCRFFLFCQGHCPGDAIDKDWRNRSEWCEVWKGLFTYTELKLLRDGKWPLSLAPDLPHWEEEHLARLAAGEGGLNYYGDPQPGMLAYTNPEFCEDRAG